MWGRFDCLVRPGPDSVWRGVGRNTAGDAAGTAGHPWQCAGPAVESLSVLLS